MTFLTNTSTDFEGDERLGRDDHVQWEAAPLRLCDLDGRPQR